MAKRKKLTRKLSNAPKTQVVRDSGAGKLPPDQWTTIASDAWQSIISAIGTRAAYESNLRTAYALYERDNRDDGIQDEPYVESSDLTIPLVFSKLRQVKAQVKSLVFAPDLFLINGLNEEALMVSPDIQTRWNWDFRRSRGAYPSWYKACDTLLHFALRDGFSVMEPSWVQDVRVTRLKVNSADLDEGEMPQVGDDGQLVTKEEYVTMPVTVYDDVVLNPVMAKDVLFMPNEAMDPQRAAAVAIYHLYYERDLRAMVENGDMNKEWVERALNYDPQGYSDYAARIQGVYNWTAGGQIDVGIGQGQGIASERL